jgi:isopentenyldiphosphate isomerase
MATIWLRSYRSGDPRENGRVVLNPAAELVTILDDDGQPCGVATRADVRAKNLLHGATAILVSRSDGRVYVHRRTLNKDIYPGAHDCWAGGVLAAGEAPEDGARRELAEELGVHDVPLRPLLVTRWHDAAVRAVYHVYAVTWDGGIVHQEDEVAWGAWWSLETLAERLADPDFAFVPDGRHLLELSNLLPKFGQSAPSGAT